MHSGVFSAAVVSRILDDVSKETTNHMNLMVILTERILDDLLLGCQKNNYTRTDLMKDTLKKSHAMIQMQYLKKMSHIEKKFQVEMTFEF